MVGWRRSSPPSSCHPHPWGPVRNLGGTNRVGWIPNCEDAPPPNIGVLRFTRFRRFARSGLVLSPVLLEALSSFSAFSAFRSVILVLRVLLAYGYNVLVGMVSGGPKMALL